MRETAPAGVPRLREVLYTPPAGGQTIQHATGASTPRRGLAAGLLVGILRGYKIYLSPLLPPLCRFEPSCSAYAAEAISRYGAGRGVVRALVRLGKCHPFHPGGYDPVD